MKTYTVPFGRIADYNHPAKERTAGKPGFRLCDDYIFTIYPTRESMKKAIEKAERNHAPIFALVKDEVPANMVICRGYQKPIMGQ